MTGRTRRKNFLLNPKSAKHPLEMLPGPGTVRVMITGICLMVPDHPRERWAVLMPEASRAHLAQTNNCVIPAHQPWVLAAMTDLDSQYSRTPLFVIKSVVSNVEYGIFPIGGELQEFSSESSTAFPSVPKFEYDPTAVHLREICGHSAISARLLNDLPGSSIAANVRLPALSVYGATVTPTAFEFQPNCPKLSTHPETRQLTHIGAIDIYTADDAFEFTAKSLAGAELQPIRFKPTAGEGVLVMIGHTPLPDIEKFINISNPHVHLGPDVHFELYYDLVESRLNHKRTVPIAIETDGTDDPIPHVGNCPYGFGDVAEPQGCGFRFRS